MRFNLNFSLSGTSKVSVKFRHVDFTWFLIVFTFPPEGNAAFSTCFVDGEHESEEQQTGGKKSQQIHE